MNEKPEIVIEMTDLSVGTMRDQSEIVLEGVNWTVARGEFWVIAGQQHSGKSAFLTMTAGLMPPAKGSYRFFGNETRIFNESRVDDRLRMGLIFENAQLFPDLTIGENVALPLQYHRNLPLPQALQAINGLLEATELKPIADVTPANLPRSWHRRAGLARALSLQPEILLLDNPFGGLDARHSHWWIKFIGQLSQGHEAVSGKPMTVVATTDDLRPWRNDARRFALLKDGRFQPLGSWKDVVATDEPIVRELMSAPTEFV